MPLSVLRGSAAPGERWTSHDSRTAVALTLYEDGLCPACGHPLHETTAEDADPGNPTGAYHYEVEPPTRCHACSAIEGAAEEHRESHAPRALRFAALRVEDAEPTPAPKE